MLNDSLIVFYSQLMCCVMLFIMYIPQILKISQTHSVEDISLTYNFLKMMLTVFSCLVLNLSDNSFIVVLAQYVSLVLSAVVMAQIYYYSFKNNDNKPILVSAVGTILAVVFIKLVFVFGQTSECIIYIVQVVSFVFIAFEYYPQIHKIHKSKSVGDISIMHWISKTFYTVLAILMLAFAHNSLIIVLTQILNLVFSLIITIQCVYYQYFVKAVK